MPNLFQIQKSLSDILEQIEQNDGELNEELERELELRSADLQKKVDNYALYLDYLKAQKEYFKKQIENYKSAIATTENLEKYLIKNVEILLKNDQKVIGDDYEFKLAKNPPSVEITNVDDIPAKYKVTEIVTKVDKKLLKEDLKNNKDIKGANLNDTNYRVKWSIKK